MKIRKIVVVIFVLLIFLPIWGNEVILGSGSETTNKLPFINSSVYSLAHYIIPGFVTNDNIQLTSMELFNTNSNIQLKKSNQEVFIRLTDASEVDDTIISDPLSEGFTKIFDGVVTWDDEGWRGFNFISPLAYISNMNLEILWRNKESSNYYNTPYFLSSSHNNASYLLDGVNTNQYFKSISYKFIDLFPTTKISYMKNNDAILISPANNIIINSLEVILAWQLNEPSNVKLYLSDDYREVYNLSEISLVADDYNIETWSLSNLYDGREYFWRIVTSSNDYTYKSTIHSFITMNNTEGDGSLNNPCGISNFEQLTHISNCSSLWDKNFEQTGNIDASESINQNNFSGFTPIGNDFSAQFIGSYNGNHYVISDLYQSYINKRCIGLFGHTEGAQIINVSLDNVTIKGTTNVGSLVGFLGNLSTVHNCNANGDVIGLGYTEGSTIGKSYSIGGLIGWNSSSVVSSSYFEGEVSGTETTGGLIGLNNSRNTIINCYSIADVYGVNRSGGLIGALFQWSKLKNSYSVGNVYGDEEVGGLIGNVHWSEYYNSYWNQDYYHEGSNTEGIALSTQNMQDSTLYINAGWDFENYWAIDENINDGYPYLTFSSDVIPDFDDGDPTLPVELTSFTAITTSNNYSQINWSTASETNLLGYNVYRNYDDNIDTAIKINTTYIQATNSPNGAQYSYTDQEVEMNSTYYYWLESTEINGFTEFFGPVSINFSDQTDDNNEVILVSELKVNYPNPFNPETTFHFFVKTGETAEFTIFNLKGQVVSSTLFETGEHKYIWKGTDKSGKKVASGIYLYKLKTESYQSVKKMIMMK